MAARGKITSPRGRHKIEKVMREFKGGKLRSGSGSPVRSRKQAIAIALAEGRRVERAKPMRAKS